MLFRNFNDIFKQISGKPRVENPRNFSAYWNLIFCGQKKIIFRYIKHNRTTFPPQRKKQAVAKKKGKKRRKKKQKLGIVSMSILSG